jgi:hypothetical protein
MEADFTARLVLRHPHGQKEICEDFLFDGLPSCGQQLMIDGRTASAPRANYSRRLCESS